MSPKVTYFNVRGLGEPVRLLLKYGKIEFEDERIDNAKWPELKQTINPPFGQLPLYEENGKVAAQSIAICRYLAKKVKLVGDNDWEALEIDAIVDTIVDFRIKCSAWFQEKDPERKEALLKTLVEETAPFYLDRLNKGVKNGYLVTGKLTWADVYMTSMSQVFERMLGADIFNKYNNLKEVVKNVSEIPAIKAWIEIRPVTDF